MNVTSWGSFKKEWDGWNKNDVAVIVINEHHMGEGDQLGRAQKWCQQRGWGAFFKVAERTGRGGTSGGTGVLWRPWARIRRLGEHYGDHRTLSFSWEQEQGEELRCTVVYGLSGQGDKNREWLEPMIVNEGRSGQPFFIIGDFNWTAKEAHEWVQDIGFPARVMSWGMTCFSKDGATDIDYAIVRKDMGSLLGNRTCIPTGLATHRAIQLELWNCASEGNIQVRESPGKRCEHEVVFGPMLAEQWEDRHRILAAQAERLLQRCRQQQYCERENQLQVAIDDMHQDWCELAVEEAQHIFGEDFEVGRPFTVVSKTPSELLKDKNTDKSNEAAVVRWMWRRVQEMSARGYPEVCDGSLHKEGRKLRQAIVHGKDQLGANKELLCEWCRNHEGMSGKWSEISGMIEARHKELEQQLRKEERAKWKGVLANDLKKGAGLWCKIIKEVKQAVYSEGQAVEAGKVYIGCSAMEQLKQQEFLWGGLWQARGVDEGIRKESPRIVVDNRQVISFSAEDIRAAAASFKIQTTHTDGWLPRHLAKMSMRALESLGKLWSVYDYCRMWPSNEAQLLVRLLMKPTGGYRPIMLHRTQHRIHSRITQKEVRKWLSGVQDHQLNMAPRRCVSDAVWRSQVRRSIDRIRRRECVSISRLNSNGTSARRATMSGGNW